MLHILDDGKHIWVSGNGITGSLAAEVILDLKSWIQRRILSREAGGVVLGFIDSETSGLIAEKLTTPTKGDKRSRYGFFRGGKHQQLANKWHVSSNLKGTVIGLWHTHPEDNPTPSRTDLQDCATFISNDAAYARGLLYIIVGRKYINLWLALPNQVLEPLGKIKV